MGEKKIERSLKFLRMSEKKNRKPEVANKFGFFYKSSDLASVFSFEKNLSSLFEKREED